MLPRRQSRRCCPCSAKVARPRRNYPVDVPFRVCPADIFDVSKVADLYKFVRDVGDELQPDFQKAGVCDGALHAEDFG